MPRPESHTNTDEKSEEDSSAGNAEVTDALQNTLASECQVFVQRLQTILIDHLASHRDNLLSEDNCLLGTIVAQPPTKNEELALLPEIEGEMSSKYGSAKSFNPETPLAAQTFTGNTSRSSYKKYKSDFMMDLAAAQNSDSADSPMMWNCVSGYHFEVACSLLILANLAVMAAEVQYNGCSLALTLDHPDCMNSVGDDAMNNLFNFFAITFSSCFFMEFVIRVIHHSRSNWREALNAWIFFDLFILSISVIDLYERLGESLSVMVNPTFMRVARVFRMLRIIKMFRSKLAFQTLFLLVKSIMASRHTLVWFILILLISMTCVGLLTNQLLFSHMSDPGISEANRREIYEYFGTYTRMLITMFEITLGNWAPPCRSLMSNVSQWWGLVIICYRCIFCFSLVNVTMACFITETGRVAADDQILMMRKVRADRKLAQTLRAVFQEIDVSGDGLMSLEELRAACNDKVMTDLLEMLDLEVHEIEELFHLMNHGEGPEGQVRQEDFVNEVLLLRGEAKCSRQVAMMKLLKDMSVQIQDVHAECRLLGTAKSSKWAGSVGSRASGPFVCAGALG